MAVIQSKKNWQLETQESRMKKGKLVRVEISPGRFVKRHEADVTRNKALAPQANKIDKGAAQNKTETEPDIAPVVSDELSSISGIGQASERALNDHGVFTFDQLFSAGKQTFLSAKINDKIRIWRDGWSADLSD